MIGLIGYPANFIQFGLDQLLEASSECLGLFVHWAVWVNNVVATVTIAICSSIFTCNAFDTDVTTSLVLSFCKVLKFSNLVNKILTR